MTQYGAPERRSEFAHYNPTDTYGRYGPLTSDLGGASVIKNGTEYDMNQPCRQDENQSFPTIEVDPNDIVVDLNAAAAALIGTPAQKLDALFDEAPSVLGHLYTLNTAYGPKTVVLADLRVADKRRRLVLVPATLREERADMTRFEDLPVPLLKIDCRGEILAFNSMAQTLLGTELALGTPLWEIMEGLGRTLPDWLSEAAKGRDAPTSEVLRVKCQRRETFVQITLTPLENGETPSLIAVLSDATELKTLEAQFVQSQKMQAIGQLAGGVAHDFNNLLTAILGYCDLLLLRHDKSHPNFDDLLQIGQNAQRAAELVGQLLAFSRKQTLHPEVLNIRDTLLDLTNLLDRLVGEKVTLNLVHDATDIAVRADRRQLEQVIMNLVVNARDAMPEGGEIRIETSIVELKTPMERDQAVVPAGRYAVIEVVDEGCGIPPDELSKVFEPFFTTKRTGEGTGLGLSTAYGIIKQTGGFIFANSVVNRGSRFSLYLPLHKKARALGAAPALDEATAAPESRDQSGAAVILLVEDEAPVRAFASRALRLQGYEVIEASCAEDALEILKNPDLHIDLFISDVIMPGLDGPTWVREALKSRPKVPVVFVSGYAEESFGDQKNRIPNSHFLPKPFSLSDFTTVVQHQLN